MPGVVSLILRIKDSFASMWGRYPLHDWRALLLMMLTGRANEAQRGSLLTFDYLLHVKSQPKLERHVPRRRCVVVFVTFVWGSRMESCVLKGLGTHSKSADSGVPRRAAVDV
jgi:hypothetical protein